VKTPIVISIINHKGGVGKTTTTINLGAALAEQGKRVLLLDLDPQSNLTQALIAPLADSAENITDVLLKNLPLEPLITPTQTENLYVVPANRRLAQLDVEIGRTLIREYLLDEHFKRTPAIQTFDYILIDNPPSISLITTNALVASDYYLIPLPCEYLPLMGLKLLKKSAKELQKFNPNLQLLGIVFTMYSKNERITQQIESLVLQQLGEQVFDARIRVNTKAKAAPVKRKTAFQFEGENGRGAVDYRALASEMVKRLEILEQGVEIDSNEAKSLLSTMEQQVDTSSKPGAVNPSDQADELLSATEETEDVAEEQKPKSSMLSRLSTAAPAE